MCSVLYLRDFIADRLTAACEQIFSEVQKTVVQYEKEINRQRRLLDISRKPDTHSHITDLQERRVCKEEILTEQQVYNQERNLNPDQEDPEPPQIKEVQEELCSSQGGEQLRLIQEAEHIWTDDEQLRLLKTIWKPEIKLHRIDLQEQRVYEEEILTEQQVCNWERNSSLDQEDPEQPQIKEDQEELCSSQEGEQLRLKQEADAFMVTHTYEESDHSVSEPMCQQLFFQNAPNAESQDQEEGQHVDSGSTRNAEMKKLHHSEKADNISVSDRQTDKRKKCDTCGKIFNYKSHLIAHLRIHTGEKPYSCNTCWKRFSRKSTLKYHIRIHTVERPYACNTCEKRFNNVSAFTRHVRVHTREKLHSCDICGKSFNRKLFLVYHIRSHTGEKPYSCSICGKRFSQKGNLKKHMKIHSR